MPSVKMPDGSVAQFPDGMKQEDIESAIADHLSSSSPSAPSRSATPAAPGLMDRIKSNWASNTTDQLGDNPLTSFSKRTARKLVDTVSAPFRDDPTPEADRLYQDTHVDQIRQPFPDAPTLASGLILGELAGPAVEGGAKLLVKGGQLARAAGAGVDNLALGTRATDRAYDTNPGAGLSKNRIIGASRSGLLNKVKAAVEPASQARDAILANSQAGPQDVTQEVNQPFNDLTARKVNPRTGATQPAAQARMIRTQRAINEVQDPQTGDPTGTPKPLDQLTPLEISQLNRNVYDMGDYSHTSPETDQMNQGIKGVGANLRDKLLQISPESADITQQLHDTLGARDVLDRQVQSLPAIPLSGGGAIRTAARGAVTGLGTTAGAGLDMLGSAMQSAGGGLRTGMSGLNPAAARPQSGAQVPSGQPPPTPMGWANATTPIPGGPGIPPPAPQAALPPGGPGVAIQPAAAGAGTVGPQPTVTVPGQAAPLPVPMPTRQLGAAMEAAALPESAGGPYSGPRVPPQVNSNTARTRPQPTTFTPPPPAPRGPYAATDTGTAQPAIPAARQLPARTAPGKRLGTLIKGWDREATSRAANLQNKVAAQSLDHSTMTDTPPPSANQSTSIDASKGKTPMGTAPPRASTPSGRLVQKMTGEALTENSKALGPDMGGQGGVSPRGGGQSLLSKVKQGVLPAPNDIDAWESLVDEGKARYNTRTHQYDYLGEGGQAQ